MIYFWNSINWLKVFLFFLDCAIDPKAILSFSHESNLIIQFANIDITRRIKNISEQIEPFRCLWFSFGALCIHQFVLNQAKTFNCFEINRHSLAFVRMIRNLFEDNFQFDFHLKYRVFIWFLIEFPFQRLRQARQAMTSTLTSFLFIQSIYLRNSVCLQTTKRMWKKRNWLEYDVIEW